MGAYVSNYRLAHAVASEGDAIGMVSGVAMDNILARVLQVIVFTTSGRRLFAHPQQLHDWAAPGLDAHLELQGLLPHCPRPPGAVKRP